MHMSVTKVLQALAIGLLILNAVHDMLTTLQEYHSESSKENCNSFADNSLGTRIGR